MAPYLTLLPQEAGQRRHELREVFNALRWLVRSGAPWRMLPNNFPPWKWLARFRRLARDYERLSDTLVGYHWVAFALLLLGRLSGLLTLLRRYGQTR